MPNQATNPDSGIRNHRVEFVREASPGETPTDPAWERFSDTLETALVTEADVQIESQRGVGDYEVQNHFSGPEDHSASIEYHLQRFFTDGAGVPADASGDAFLRAANGGVKNTHTVVDRADHGGTRTYTVAKGAYPNLDELSGDPGSGLPIVVTLAYEVKNVRSYKVGQPDGETLTVSSTDASDTSQTLTIESDDGTTTEDVLLGGTTSVTTTESFSSIDALELDAETVGDIVVEDGSGNELARLYGANSYDTAGGDLGIPALGAGSHADPIDTDYEVFLDDQITQGGADLAAEIRSASCSVSNNYEKAGVAGTTEQAVHVGQQDLEFTATVAGDFQGHENLTDHVQANEFDLEWTLDGGTITFAGCVLSSPGEVGPSSGDVISVMDSGFTAKSVDFTAN
jgi:hypothetical protein